MQVLIIKYNVAVITCQFENGNKASLRHTVVDMLVVKNNQILLVKRADGFLEGGKYALVGGFVNRDETTIEAAKREIMEETGYVCEIMSLFRVVDNPNRRNEDRQNISFVYLVKPLEKIGTSDHEIKEIKWFDLDTLPPAQEIAFDHLDNIKLYKQYIKKQFALPLLK